MKKIPTLFVREFEGHEIKRITDQVTPGCEAVLRGETLATVKYDGACCAVIEGRFYKRYDAKKGKQPPPDAIPCCEPDPVTGHWPHWVPVDEENPGDRWFVAAYRNSCIQPEGEATYEAIGPHFQGNPYGLALDTLVMHGLTPIYDVELSFAGIRDYLKAHSIEGIVFWTDNGPLCKIKRTDYGFPWPVKG